MCSLFNGCVLYHAEQRTIMILELPFTKCNTDVGIDRLPKVLEYRLLARRDVDLARHTWQDREALRIIPKVWRFY